MNESSELKTGISYIANFANCIYELNSCYSNYRCICAELNSLDMKNLTEEQKTGVLKIIQNLRHMLHKSYILYNGLQSLKLNNDKSLSKLFKKIDSETVPNLELCEKIVIEFNKYLASNTVNRLLETSEDFVNQVFNKNDRTENS